MGGTASSKKGLNTALNRAETRMGKHTVSGRYRRLPQQLDDDYAVETKVLGTGYNGSVFRATNKITGGVYAVKGFHLTGIASDKMRELETECEIFLSMDHPHVARLVDVYESESRLNLVMECMEGGELFERVRAKKRFSEADTVVALRQMFLAVNYLHTQGIVHRDLKLENFLYEKKDSDHLKLIDFGFSHVWEPNTKMKLSCGTLNYVAPEVLDRSYTSQCDLWSMGVITFILISGYMPFFGDEEEQILAIKAGRWVNKPDKWAKVSAPAKDFVRALLTVDPANRLTAEQALQHQFLQESGEDRAEVDTDIVSALQDFAQASEFRRACMSVMAWSLTNEERSKVREAFITMDTSRQGTITLSELKTVMTEQFHIEDAQVQSIFQALDTGNNHVIHYSEFLAAMVSTRIAMHDDLLRATFQRFDVDKSGNITIENLRTVLGDTFSDVEVENLLKEADADGNGEISYDEFFAYLKNEAASDGKLMSAADKLLDAELEKKKGSPRSAPHVSEQSTKALKGKSHTTHGLNVSAGGESAEAKSKTCAIL